MKGLSIILLTFFCLTSLFAQTDDISGKIPFQGKLESNGEPVTEKGLAMVFSLKNGEETWTETHAVDIENGLFFVVLGTESPIPAFFFNVSNLQVEIKIATESPIFLPLIPTPQAHYAWDLADNVLEPTHFTTAASNRMLATDNSGRVYWARTPEVAEQSSFGGNVQVTGNTTLGSEESSTTQITGALQLTDFTTLTGGENAGMMRYNTQDNKVQVFTNNQWYDMAMDGLNFNTLGISSQSETLIQGGLILGNFDGDPDAGMVRYENNILEIYDGINWRNVGNLATVGNGITKDETINPAIQLGGKLLQTTVLETENGINLEVTGTGKFKVEGGAVLGFMTVTNNSLLGVSDSTITEVGGTLKLNDYQGTTLEDGMMRYSGGVFQIRQLGIWETLATTSGSWDLGGNGSTDATSFIGTTTTNPLNFGVNSNFFMSATTSELGISHPIYASDKIYANNSIEVENGMVLNDGIGSGNEGEMRFSGNIFSGYSNGIWNDFLTVGSALDNAIIQNGNAFGTNMEIGANDAFDLVLKAHGNPFLSANSTEIGISNPLYSGDKIYAKNSIEVENGIILNDGIGSGNEGEIRFSGNKFSGYSNGIWNDFLTVGSALDNAIIQNGNAFGTATVIGTADNENLIFRANGTDFGAITTKGAFYLKDAVGSNVFVGENAGNANNTGTINVFLGQFAGQNYVGESANTAIGWGAGELSITGASNVFVGASAGRNVQTGANVIIGQSAGYGASGSGSTLIGYRSGFTNHGAENTFVGAETGTLAIGAENTFIGHFSGRNNLGNSNIFLGHGAGNNATFQNESNKLIIANSASNTPLIFGDFADDFVSVNGNLVIGNGSAVGDGMMKFENDKFSGYSGGWNDFVTVAGLNSLGWTLSGNSGTNSASDFIGTTDLQNVVFKANNSATLTFTTAETLEFGNANQNLLIGDDVSTSGTNNILIGNNAGKSLSVIASNNIISGVSTGLNYTDITNSIIIGHKAGSGNIGGHNADALVFIGEQAGFQNEADNNTMIGYYAGHANTIGTMNTFLGVNSGEQNGTGSNNVFLGHEAGTNNTSGSSNIVIGKSAGAGSFDGTNNVIVGETAGYNAGDENIILGQSAGHDAGDGNVILGHDAGQNAGTGNIMLGYQAGQNEAGDDKLYIANTNTSNPLIYGDFSNDFVSINGILAIGNSGAIANQGMIRYDGTQFAGHNGNWVNFVQSNKYYEDGNNLFIGNKNADSGNYNTFLGSNAGIGNTTGNNNVFLGESAGAGNTTGNDNIFIGKNAGTVNATAIRQIAIGYGAGSKNNAGGNIFMGWWAGESNNTGGTNVAIGNEAGRFNNGNKNVFIGHSAGEGDGNIPTVWSGSGNVFIGHQVGMAQASLRNVSNTLAIDNSNTATPLIYGDFSNKFLTVNGHAYIKNKLGVGLNETPITKVHIMGETAAAGGGMETNILLVENKGTGGNNRSILGLNLKGHEFGGTVIDGKRNGNYITFYHQDIPVGAIDGEADTDADGVNTASGADDLVIGESTVTDKFYIRFKSGGADYAEWMLKMDSLEKFKKGQIVGVKDGKITKNTENASDLKVISTSAVVLGNWKGKESEDKMEQVAFLGQVPILVSGKVKTGDLIIASGKNDGTGLAVSESKITPEQYKNIVGTAWTASENEGLKYVLVAVGMKTPEHQISSLMENVQNLKSENQDLKNQVESQDEKINKLESDFQKLSQMIEQLKNQSNSSDFSDK